MEGSRRQESRVSKNVSKVYLRVNGKLLKTPVEVTVHASRDSLMGVSPGWLFVPIARLPKSDLSQTLDNRIITFTVKLKELSPEAAWTLKELGYDDATDYPEWQEN